MAYPIQRVLAENLSQFKKGKFIKRPALKAYPQVALESSYALGIMSEMGLNERYVKVNEALNITLLSGRYEGRPFYLSLESVTRAEIADALGIEAAAVERAVAQAVANTLMLSGDPYLEHLGVAGRWRRAGQKQPPPFTAVLFTLSHAASMMTQDNDFSGSNFYDRLGELLDFSADSLRTHGKSTLPLWQMFNRWLIANDYEYGRPTARQFNSWTYVNYPQTQAIVRRGDRKLFHHLFETYGLSSHDDMSIEEIRTYLQNWIHTSASNDRLRAAWARQELRDRLCEVVLAELQDWSHEDEQNTENGGVQKARLSAVAALIHQFPKSKLSLLLGRKGELGTAGDAFASSDGHFTGRLANEVYGGFATLSPNPLSTLSGTLEKGVFLRNAGATKELVWQPRLVMPFSASGEGPYWVETNRVGLGSEHLLLVRNVGILRNKVDGYLLQASTGRAQLASPDMLAGLPNGWLLYKNVVIIKVIGEVEDGLEALVPLQEEGGAQLTGGLQLARGIWHVSRPPRAVLIAGSGKAQLDVYKLGDEGSPLISAGNATRGALIEPTQFSELGDGEYSVHAAASGKSLNDVTVVLRSASKPRPRDRRGEDLIVFLKAASAEEIKGDLPEAYVEGVATRGMLLNAALPAARQIGFALPAGQAEVATNEFVAVERRQGEGQTCVERGYHYYKCETLPPELPRWTPLRMECKDCHQSVLTKNRGKKPRKFKMKSKPTPAKVDWKRMEVRAPRQMDHDLLFDALCFLGIGTLGRLENVMSEWVEEPWQVGSVAASYSSLGLLDLSLEPGSGRISRWSVPPPAVCFTSGRSAFLTGFRCEELTDSVRSAVESHGGSVVSDAIAGQPARIAINHLDASSMVDALDGVTDPLGRSIEIVESGAASLTAACLQLGGLNSVLLPMEIGRSDRLQVFDCSKARWKDATSSDPAGAYRMEQGSTIYFFRNKSGKAFRGPHQLVKLLAARQDGARLHAYDPEQRTFMSTLGCEPIGLLNRALACSSGELPSLRAGSLSYPAVSFGVAGAILHLMYEERIEP